MIRAVGRCSYECAFVERDDRTGGMSCGGCHDYGSRGADGNEKFSKRVHDRQSEKRASSKGGQLGSTMKGEIVFKYVLFSKQRPRDQIDFQKSQEA